MIEILKELMRIVAQVIKNPFRLRTILLFISAFIGCTFYYYIAIFLSLDHKVFDYHFEHKEYKFFSGSPGGIYFTPPYSLRIKLHADYETGGITDVHHSDLMQHIYSVKNRIQNIFGQYLRDDFMHNKPIPLDMLRRYYMTGYLLKEDFFMLRKRFYDGASGD